MGATFEFGPDDCHIRVSDIRRMQCTIWASVPWVRAHCRKHRTKHEDVDMERAHYMFEVWSESSPSNQGSQSPMSRNKLKPSPETSFRMPDKPPSQGSKESQRPNHVKMLQFSDVPES